MRALEPGQVIPEWSLPLTPTTIVSTAIATRDWQDVHHDRDIAQAAGSKDIFMNILTSNGLVERYVAAQSLSAAREQVGFALDATRRDRLGDREHAFVIGPDGAQNELETRLARRALFRARARTRTRRATPPVAYAPGSRLPSSARLS